MHRSALPATIHELNSAGEVANYGLMLQDAHIMPGATIQNDEGERFHVVAVGPLVVDGYDASDKKRKKMSMSARKVLEEYKVLADVPTTVTGNELAKLAPSLNDDIQFEIAVCCLKVALARKEQEIVQDISKLTIVTSAPTNARTVVAKEGFAKGAKLFVPCSMNIIKAVDGKSYPESAVHVKKLKSPVSAQTWDVVVMPKISVPASGDDTKSAIIPSFWFAKTTIHAEVANAHIVYEECKLGDGEGCSVDVPIMAAKKAIQAGAVIMYHRPKKSS